ncbi:MAG: hypothetical protein CVU39_18485 [Chloroflexi bacterium HGW-Chloroflexi-10]|nr:MAG: hypothetical protein CVU39_18485 [Chloroflexi bacterium HGW-Chloroflexi-10]
MIENSKQIHDNTAIHSKHDVDSRLSLALLVFIGILISLLASYHISEGNWFIVGVTVALVSAIVLLFAQPFLGVIAWLVIMPFVSALPRSDLVYWAIYRILPPFLLFLAVFSRMVKDRQYPTARLGPPELTMIILVMYIPASIILTQASPSLAIIRFGDRVILPFCMYLVMRLLAPREKEFTQLVWAALFIALSQSIVGFLSWYAPHVLPKIWHYLNGIRTTGTVKDPDLYALLLVFSAVLLIHAAVNKKSILTRLFFYLVSGICALFAFLSLERAAWLGGLFVTIGLVFLFPKTMLRLLFFGVIVAIILSAGILSTHVSLSIERFSESNPVYDRLVVFDAMSQMFAEKPMSGWGYETLDGDIQQYYRRVGEASISTRLVTSHNTYMTILTELGLLGFILYIFPVIWWFILSGRVWRRIPKSGYWSRPLLGSLWLIMGFNFTICNFFDMRWFGIGLILWWMVLGLIANMVYPYLKNRELMPVFQPALEIRHE